MLYLQTLSEKTLKFVSIKKMKDMSTSTISILHYLIVASPHTRVSEGNVKDSKRHKTMIHK